MLNIAFIVGMALQFIVIYTPWLNDVFNLQALTIVPLLVSMGLAVSIVVIMEIYKLVKRLINK